MNAITRYFNRKNEAQQLAPVVDAYAPGAPRIPSPDGVEVLASTVILRTGRATVLVDWAGGWLLSAYGGEDMGLPSLSSPEKYETYQAAYAAGLELLELVAARREQMDQWREQESRRKAGQRLWSATSTPSG